MVQRREHFRFAPKPREPIVVGGERWWQDLDRDLAFQLRVRRAEHLSHPTLADLGSDLIGAEAGAWSQGQVAGSIAVEGCCGRVYSCNTPIWRRFWARSYSQIVTGPFWPDGPSCCFSFP